MKGGRDERGREGGEVEDGRLIMGDGWWVVEWRRERGRGTMRECRV